jgi:hypothetical protein
MHKSQGVWSDAKDRTMEYAASCSQQAQKCSLAACEEHDDGVSVQVVAGCNDAAI